METTKLKTYKLNYREAYYNTYFCEWIYPQNGIKHKNIFWQCPQCSAQNRITDVLDMLLDSDDVEFTDVECAECEKGYQLNIYGERQYIPHEMVLKELEEI